VTSRAKAIAALLVAPLMAGCGGAKSAPAPPTRVIVARSLQSTAALRSFSFELKVEHAPSGRPGLTLTLARGDLVVPDRLRARINGTFSRTPIQSEIIIIGHQSFLRDPLTKQWRPFVAAPNPGMLINGVPTVIRRARGLRNAGSEKVGGVDTYRLSGEVPAAVVAPFVGVKANGRLVRFTLWTGQKDFRLRRIRLTAPVGEGDPADIVRTVDISNFDESVAITAPAVSG
jgi:LppX/LprAFG-like lipoprotein